MAGFFKRRHGFTIIEILVVITVVGILAGIVIVSYNAAQTQAQDTRTVSITKSVADAVNAYYTKNGTYPFAASEGATEVCLSQNSNGTSCGKTYSTGDCSAYGIDTPGTMAEITYDPFLQDQLKSFISVSLPEVEHPPVEAAVDLDSQCRITYTFTGPVYASGCSIQYVNGKPTPVIGTQPNDECSSGPNIVAAKAYAIIYFLRENQSTCPIAGSYNINEYYSNSGRDYKGTVCMYAQGKRNTTAPAATVGIL